MPDCDSARGRVLIICSTKPRLAVLVIALPGKDSCVPRYGGAPDHVGGGENAIRGDFKVVVSPTANLLGRHRNHVLGQVRQLPRFGIALLR